MCYQPLVVCDKDGATLKLFARRRCWVGVGESPLPAFETLGVADCEPPPIEAIAKLLLLINPLLLISLPDKRDDSSDFCCCADAPKPVAVSPATSIGWCAWYIPKPMNSICAFVWCVVLFCFVVLCDRGLRNVQLCVKKKSRGKNVNHFCTIFEWCLIRKTSAKVPLVHT